MCERLRRDWALPARQHQTEVSLTKYIFSVWGILKNVTQVVQRVVFLHEDLVKLPSFPRKALEAELDLFGVGEIGKVNKTFTPINSAEKQAGVTMFF